MLRFSVVAAVSGGMFLCSEHCLCLMKKVQYCADSQCRMYIYSTQKNSLVVYQLEKWLIEGWTCIKFYLYCFKKWHWILVNYVFFGWGGDNTSDVKNKKTYLTGTDHQIKQDTKCNLKYFAFPHFGGLIPQIETFWLDQLNKCRRKHWIFIVPIIYLM